MRKIVILPLLALLAVPAVADAGAKLWLKDARRAAARVAAQDVATQRGEPPYVVATNPVCRRLSRVHATCDYTIVHYAKTRSGPGGVESTCKRRVDVTFDLGAQRASARRLLLNCYLNDNPDYEV